MRLVVPVVVPPVVLDVPVVWANAAPNIITKRATTRLFLRRFFIFIDIGRCADAIVIVVERLSSAIDVFISIDVIAGCCIDVIVIIRHCSSIDIVIIICQCARVDVIVVERLSTAIHVIVRINVCGCACACVVIVVCIDASAIDS